MAADDGTRAVDDGTRAVVDQDDATETPTGSSDPSTTSHDVVVVGGGPAGASAAVFTARYGLDTVVFDLGNAALRRCAYLENYLGFPGGVDVDAFHDLMHAHLEAVGAALVADRVESVRRIDDGDGEGMGAVQGDGPGRFLVETQDGREVTTDYVVAAAWYDGSYLRGLEDPAMFTEQEHHGELEERFDHDYPDADGRTDIDGLYVASPAGARSAQAIVAAGNGAHVARSLLADHRREEGYAGGVSPHYDWLRRDAEFSGEWADRDRWREWFANEFDADAGDEERFEELRETYLDHAFETRLTEAEADERFERGLERLVDVVGTDRVLDTIDDEALHAYLDDRLAEPTDDQG